MSGGVQSLPGPQDGGAAQDHGQHGGGGQPFPPGRPLFDGEGDHGIGLHGGHDSFGESRGGLNGRQCLQPPMDGGEFLFRRPAVGAGGQVRFQPGLFFRGESAVQPGADEFPIFVAAGHVLHLLSARFHSLDGGGEEKFPDFRRKFRRAVRALAIRDLTVPSSRSRHRAISP